MMRVSSYTNNPEGENRIEICGLTHDEKETLLAMMKGMWWIRGQNGKLESAPGFKPQPEPEDDPATTHHWPQTCDRKVSYSQLQFRDPSEYRNNSPSFIIQSVCGYNYTKENYASEAARLKGYGFECLRSKRGDSGTFWEIWYLSGLWSAKGELKEAVEKAKQTLQKSGKPIPSDSDERVVRQAISFLCRTCSFGTLDVCVQRAAMTID